MVRGDRQVEGSERPDEFGDTVARLEHQDIGAFADIELGLRSPSPMFAGSSDSRGSAEPRRAVALPKRPVEGRCVFHRIGHDRDGGEPGFVETCSYWPTMPSIIPEGATMSAPASASRRPYAKNRECRVIVDSPSTRDRSGRGRVLAQARVCNAQQVRTSDRSADSAFWTMPSSTCAHGTERVFDSGRPKRMKSGRPRPRRAGPLRRLVYRKLVLPGIDEISRRMPSPGTTKYGCTNCAGFERVFAHHARRIRKRRSRRGRSTASSSRGYSSSP